MAGTITSAFTDVFKQGLLEAEHDFTSHTFKIGLFKTEGSLSASYGANSEDYTDITGNSDENAGSGYSAGGQELTKVAPTHDSTNHVGYADFSNDPTWAGSTISSDGCFIYNDSHASKEIVLVVKFASTRQSSGGDFVLQFPSADYQNAIIRLA